MEHRRISYIFLFIIVLISFVLVFVNEALADVTYTPENEIKWILQSSNNDEIITVKELSKDSWQFDITPNPSKLTHSEIKNYPFEAFRLTESGKEYLTDREITFETISKDIKSINTVIDSNAIDLTLNDGVIVHGNYFDLIGTYIKYGVHSATYTAISNQIQWDGNTIQLREDIYQADIANGWNVVTKCGSQCYCSTASIYINSGIVSDSGGSLEFADNTSTCLSSNTSLELYNMSISTNEQTPYNIGGAIPLLFRQINTGTCNLDNIFFSFPYSKTSDTLGIIQLNEYGIVNNCTFSNGVGILIDDPNITMIDNKINNGKYVIVNTYDMENSNLYINESEAGISILSIYDDINIYNVDIVNCNTTINMFGSVYPVSLYNCYSDNWVVSWTPFHVLNENLNIYYSFDLLLTTQSGTPIQNANITISDIDNNVVSNLSTSASGTITKQWLEYGYYKPGSTTIILTSPHNIKISAVGYEAYEDIILMNEEKDLKIALTPINESEVNMEFLIWALIPLTFTVLYYTTKMRELAPMGATAWILFAIYCYLQHETYFDLYYSAFIFTSFVAFIMMLILLEPTKDDKIDDEILDETNAERIRKLKREFSRKSSINPYSKSRIKSEKRDRAKDEKRIKWHIDNR